MRGTSATYEARPSTRHDESDMTVASKRPDRRGTLPISRAGARITSERAVGTQPAQHVDAASRQTRSRSLYNVDYEDARPEDDPAWAARAEVGQVAASVAAFLADAGHDAQLVAVDGDLAALRTRLAELEADCAFNLCESLVRRRPARERGAARSSSCWASPSRARLPRC